MFEEENQTFGRQGYTYRGCQDTTPRRIQPRAARNCRHVAIPPNARARSTRVRTCRKTVASPSADAHISQTCFHL